MTPEFDFSGRKVFVAGGTSGINLGIAEAFAKRGAIVGVISRSEERVKSAAERLNAVAGNGGQGWGQAADVRQPDTVQSALEAFSAEFGAIDVCVSGAAGNFLAAALDMSPNAFRTVVDIDLNGTFNVLRLAHPYLRKPGASCITISAPQATTPTKFQAHACAAKAGVDMLTRVLAQEWGHEGIRVNGIVPGPIRGTEGLERLVNTPEAKERMLASTPINRLGELEDVANMAMTLATDLTSYVTGAIIPVDGGRTIAGGSDYGSDIQRRNA